MHNKSIHLIPAAVGTDARRPDVDGRVPQHGMHIPVSDAAALPLPAAAPPLPSPLALPFLMCPSNFAAVVGVQENSFS